jgi:hypothetical protein
MKKGVVIGIIVLGVLFLSKYIVEALKDFLDFLTSFLSYLHPLESIPQIGLVAGLGVALFAFLLILLLFFAVAIIQFLLSRP